MALPEEVEAALAALDLPPSLPDPRRLDELLRRFAFAVPVEAVPGSPRPQEVVLASFAGEGTGASGDERTAAFAHLARALGHVVEPLAAVDGQGHVHRVLAIVAGGNRLLADPAFPLPLALALDGDGGEVPTGYGRLSVRPGPEGPVLWLDARGEERPLYTVSGSATRAAGPPALCQARGTLFRLLDDRFHRWRGGLLEVADAWSRLRFPLPATDRSGLESFFPLAALDAVENGAVPPAGAELRAYDASPLTVSELRSRLAARNELASRLFPDGAPGLEIEQLPDGAVVRPGEGTTDPCARRYRLEERPWGTRVTVILDLGGLAPLPQRGLTEGTRKSLVFELVQGLFALSAG